MVSLEEEDLHVFNYLYTSEIWSDKRGGERTYKRVVSLEEEDLHVFNCLYTSEIWSDKRGERGLIRGWSHLRRRIYMYLTTSIHLTSGLIRGGREAL